MLTTETLSQFSTATVVEINDALTREGYNAGCVDDREARAAITRVCCRVYGPFDLYDSETNEVIREATEEETVESVLAGPEGHILVDGQRCYVAE